MYGFLSSDNANVVGKETLFEHLEHWFIDKMLKTAIFWKIMARDRYMLLWQMLHFNDNNIIINDPIITIRPVVDKLKKSFSCSFTLYENLCIDENLSVYKGRCYVEQFISYKRSRLCIEIFILCNCETN
jgi:hypothetical protein